MPISKTLSNLKLISGQQTCNVFDSIYGDILEIDYNSESEFICDLWSRYTPSSKSLNGRVFEGLIAVALYRSSILPLFIEAKLTFVPNISFDFIAYSKEHGPIILSAKTSLRERYKQADLEGMMLRQVHRRSKSYLITNDETEANLVNRKIESGQALGLDDVIIATSEKFDELISDLKKLNYYAPEKVDILTSSRFVDKS